MTGNEYQQAALRTAPDGIFQDKILNGVMGLCGESGECMDILKKYIFQGHTLDIEHLAKELGDVAWYLAISADAIGLSLEDIFEININKLKERYPKGFDSVNSIYRKENDI